MAGTVAQRREYAERAARECGFQGRWPPPPVHRPESGDGIRGAVAQLRQGEHRAGVTALVGHHLARFVFELNPDDFRQAAEVVMRVAGNRKNTAKARLRAVRAGILPLRNLVALADRLRRQSRRVAPELAEHLSRCLWAFCEGLGPEGTGELAKLGRELLSTSRGTTAIAVVEQISRAQAETAEALVMLGWKPVSRSEPTDSEIGRNSPRQADIRRLLSTGGNSGHRADTSP